MGLTGAPLWAGLFPVIRRVVARFELRNLEPLRIGAGKGEKLGGSVDLPVYRQRVVRPDGGVVEEPVIPGSSFKGVLRTASMSLAASCGVEAHSGVKGDDCVHVFESYAEELGARLSFDDFRKRASPDDVRRVVLGFCPVCMLYGAQSVAARVAIGDFVPGSDASVGVKTGVGIDRRKGSAAKGVLYSVEFVEPGTVFGGSVSLVNAPNWLLGLFAKSLLMVSDGWLKLGGFKSRGMGRVEILWDYLRVDIWEPGGGQAALKPLDDELDEQVGLEDCGGGAGLLVCRGPRARSLLERLAGLWDELCRSGKLVKVLGERRDEALKLYAGYAANQ